MCFGEEREVYVLYGKLNIIQHIYIIYNNI